MRSQEIWEQVHAERGRLSDDLSTLSPVEWRTPSLCPGWSVHDVLAHLLDTVMTGRVAFIWSMARALGDFDRANEHGVRRRRRDDPRETLEAFREVRRLTRTPPAQGATRLVEAFVHGEDIRRPLGIPGRYPSSGVHEALAYQIRTPRSFGGGREAADGLRLVDSESGAEWGSGDEVAGEAIDLLLAVSGRPVSQGRLSGGGAARLLGGRTSA